MQTKLEAAAEKYKQAREWRIRAEAESRHAHDRFVEARNLASKAQEDQSAAHDALLLLIHGQPESKARLAKSDEREQRKQSTTR